MKNQILGIFAVILTVSGCGQPALTSDEKAIITAEIEGVMAGLITDIEKLDADRAFGYFLQDNNTRMVSQGVVHANIDSLTEVYRKVYGNLDVLDITGGEANIVVLGRDAAVVTAANHERVVPKEGEAYDLPFAWTFVWVKRNGTWKLLHAHQSFP